MSVRVTGLITRLKSCSFSPLSFADLTINRGRNGCMTYRFRDTLNAEEPCDFWYFHSATIAFSRPDFRHDSSTLFPTVTVTLIRSTESINSTHSVPILFCKMQFSNAYSVCCTMPIAISNYKKPALTRVQRPTPAPVL